MEIFKTQEITENCYCTVENFFALSIDLDHKREYKELWDKKLATKGFERYIVKKVEEKVKFNLNETGVKMEVELELYFKN